MRWWGKPNPRQRIRRLRRSLLALSCATAILACCGCKPPSPQNGEVVFKKSCAPCHQPAHGVAKFAPSLDNYYRKVPRPTDNDTGRLIRNGRNFMPPFGRRLTSQQIDDLIAYLKILP